MWTKGTCEGRTHKAYDRDVILHLNEIILLIKVECFSKICRYTSFHGPNLPLLSPPPEKFVAMLFLLILWNCVSWRYVREWLQWHNIRTKSHKSRSTGLNVEMGDTQRTWFYKPIYFPLRKERRLKINICINNLGKRKSPVISLPRNTAPVGAALCWQYASINLWSSCALSYRGRHWSFSEDWQVLNSGIYRVFFKRGVYFGHITDNSRHYY
jgi:hypothetical protein